MSKVTKPKVFTAPDGREFTDRKEYRMYMMETFYSFKSQHGEHDALVKHPGDVAGQPFDIADCVECTLIVMDTTEQVQIDNLINCRVFIGACSSTLFVRNCHNCTFFSCSRQLRVTEVTSSAFYSYCPSEIHIELCKGLYFAPFLGGYPQQKAHFRENGFDPLNNRWNDIYDHSDPKKNGSNWTILDPTEYEAAWFPTGEVSPQFIAVQQQQSANSSEEQKDTAQVGESFSLQQMMADAERLKAAEAAVETTTAAARSSGAAVTAHASSIASSSRSQQQQQQIAVPTPKPTQRVTLETALLVATAESMDINLSVWFNEQANDGRITVKEFMNKLVSLGTSLSMNQDPETKRELDLAISKESLRAAVGACEVPSVDPFNRLVDITYFIQLCQNQVEEHIAELDTATAAVSTSSAAIAATNSGVSAPDSWISSADSTAEGSLRHSQLAADSMITALPATDSELNAMYADDEEQDGDELFDYLNADAEREMKPFNSRLGSIDKDERATDISMTAAASAAAAADERSPEAEEYLRDIMAKAGFNVDRPKPAPAGVRGEQRGESLRDTFSPQLNSNATAADAAGAVHTSESALLPQSPYDEEVAFDFYEDATDEDEDVDSTYLNARKGTNTPSTLPASAVENKQYWADQNRHLLNASSERQHSSSSGIVEHKSDSRLDRLQPRPSSAGPRLNANRRKEPTAAEVITDTALHPDHISRRLDHLARSTGELRRRSSSAGRLRSTSADPQNRRRKSFSGGTMPMHHSRAQSTEEQLSYMKELVEDLVRETVKKADLYHVLQVQLGFIEAYTMIPPRGEIVTCKKRDWISNRELQTAFIAARLCLTEPQLIVLKGLVHNFAKQFDALYSSRAAQIINVPETTAINVSSTGAAVGGTDIKTRRQQQVPHYASSTGAHHHQQHPQQQLSHEDEEVADDVREKMPPSVLNISKETATSGLTSKGGASRKTSAAGSTAGDKKSPTLGPKQTLSAAWLKKYLVHLRLTKKVAPFVAGNATTAGTGTAVRARNSTTSAAITATMAGNTSASQEHVPLLWKEWLGKKMQSELKKGTARPKDFERALSGQPHPLTKEDIDTMIRAYCILPQEVLQQEVECRIESWLLDMDGRRDFPHQMNVHIRKWIWAKIKADGIRISPKDKKGNWRIWQRLPEEEKQRVKKDVLNTIIHEKRETLLSKERTHQSLTRELFDSYDTEAKRRIEDSEKPVEWNQWLAQHLEKFLKTLQDFRQSEQERLRKLAQELKQRKTVAGLAEVKSKMMKAKEDYKMNTFEESELLRSLHELERVAEARGIAKGALVTKADFVRLMKNVLAPYISLDGDADQQQQSTGSGSSSSGKAMVRGNMISRGDIEAMFHAEKDKAVEKVIEIEEKKREEARKDFKQWLQEKDNAREELLRKKKEERSAAKKAEEERKRKGKKVWKQWCVMRSKNLYKSTVDKKKHVIPRVKSVPHKERWNSDKELNDFYDEMEKKF